MLGRSSGVFVEPSAFRCSWDELRCHIPEEARGSPNQHFFPLHFLSAGVKQTKFLVNFLNLNASVQNVVLFKLGGFVQFN